MLEKFIQGQGLGQGQGMRDRQGQGFHGSFSSTRLFCQQGQGQQ